MGEEVEGSFATEAQSPYTALTLSLSPPLNPSHHCSPSAAAHRGESNCCFSCPVPMLMTGECPPALFFFFDDRLPACFPPPPRPSTAERSSCLISADGTRGSTARADEEVLMLADC